MFLILRKGKKNLYIQYRSAKYFELNSPIFFEPQGLMADWGRGFTSPQPLPNQRLSRSKETFN